MYTVGTGVIRRLIAGVPLGTAPDNVKGSKWAYATNDTAAAVEGAGFFNPIAAQLRVGDQIDASLDLDGTPARKDYMVTSIAAGVVTIIAAAA